MAVRVQYTYRHCYCDLRGYSDRGGKVGETVAVRVQYTYRHSYFDLRGYSTRTATVTVTYADTLTEGGRGESGSTFTVHVPPQLL